MMPRSRSFVLESVILVESTPSPREIFILLLIALAPCVILGHITAETAARDPDNELTFLTATASWEHYLELRQEWRPRILSNLSAHTASRIARAATDDPILILRRTISFHSSGWLLLMNITLIAAWGRKAMPFIWGIFAAVMFGYASGLDKRIYPWDLPGLYLFALFVICHARRWHRALPFVIAAGPLFKETTIVLCIAPIFLMDGPMRARLIRVGLWLLLFGIVKIIVDLFVGNPLPFFSMSVHPPGTDSFRVMSNLRGAIQPRFANPLLINAGTLAAFLLLPNTDSTLRMFKCIAVIFALNLLVFGRILEYRIWFELAPLAIYALLCHFGQITSPTSQRTAEANHS